MKLVLSRRAALVGLGALALGCNTAKPPRAAPGPPRSADIKPARLDYVDSEAFDLLFETNLLNGQPVIVVQTDRDKPEWGSRLNAWIAAWNATRRADGLKFRGQIPAATTVVVDGDSIREFRLLIDGLMGRVDESARTGTQWWAEKQLRERRVALLKPYGLRFHLDANNRIQLIFFHGGYAAQYEDVVRALADPEGEEQMEWSPDYLCSRSRVQVKTKRPSE